MSNRHLPTLLAVFVFALSGCSGSKTTSAGGPVVLQGAGATAPLLAYSKWIEAYAKVEPAVKIHYEATGSGDGIAKLEQEKVDFAASDIPLTDEQMSKIRSRPYHFPALMGAIVPVYNLPGIIELKFSGETLAGIFSGRVKNWNDAALAKLNPGVALPSSRIAVLHRADASGSTYVFTDFLSKTSPRWKQEIGMGATVAWPTGDAQRGNEALAKAIKSTPASIGYVELNYANAQSLTYGAVQNAAGKFKKPDLEALGAAIEVAQGMKHDFRASLTNAPGENAYPICTLTWLIVPENIENPAKLKQLKSFLRWMYEDGQKIAMSMDYGVIQPPLRDYARDQVANLK